MMIDMQVGENIADYDNRQVRALGYLAAQDIKSAIIELTNQRQTLHHALENYSPCGMALAVTVYSIDGVVYTNYQEDGLNLILDKLDEIGYTKNQLDGTLEEVKKKTQNELLIYHASKFSLDLNYNAAKIKELSAQIDGILGLDTEKEVQDAEFEMLRLSKAEIWNIYIAGNAALELENSFETFMFSVQEHTKEDLDNMSVYRFYCLLDHIKNKKNG